MILQGVQEINEGGHAMVETFRILPYRNSDNLHLRLTGLLGEEGALSLIEALNENRALVKTIFVHTAALNQVLDSGAELLRSGLRSLDRPGAEIIFTGKKGEQLALRAPGIRFMR
jgi:hypothetical protein